MTTAVRYGLPAAMFTVGIVLIAFGGDAAMGAGIVLAGSAFLVLLFNLFTRLGIQSQDDREHEERAREHLRRHGRWPDR